MDDIFITRFDAAGHVYAIAWTPRTINAAMCQLGRWASNPEMPLTWWQAAQIAARLREQMQTVECGGR